jgi:integrase
MARTKAGTVPKLQHHKASGQGRVLLDGRHWYCGKWGTPECKATYDRLVAEWLHNGRRLPSPPKPSHSVSESAPPSASTEPVVEVQVGPGGVHVQHGQPPAPGGLLLCEIAARYIEHCEIYYRDAEGNPTSTFGNAKQAITALEPYEDLPAEAFGPKKLQEMRTLLVQQGRSRNGCNTIVKAVKRLFRWAESQELVHAGHVHSLETVEPLKKGRTLAPESPPVKPVADSVIDATIKHLPKVVADMVRIQRLTGARPSEVCRMRPCDFDCERDVWEYRPFRHKTDYLEDGVEKIIPIGPRAQAILAPYFTRPADAFCFSPLESEANRHHEMRARRKSKVQPSQRNRRSKKPKRPPQDHYTRDSYRRAVQRAAAKAKVIQWTPHQIRHTTATEVRRQFGVEASQTYLGHKDANITQIYAERNFKLARDVASKIG